jgi:hypothetical protein
MQNLVENVCKKSKQTNNETCGHITLFTDTGILHEAENLFFKRFGVVMAVRIMITLF